MVKKFTFHMQGNASGDGTSENDADDKDDDDATKNAVLRINHVLHQHLKVFKEHITCFYENRKWDRYKKFVNEYELIFTTCHGFPSLSHYLPTSRSFFKLWEVLHDFEPLFRLQEPTPQTCAFLAEGPGGFLEAYIEKRRRSCPQARDILYGNTLRSEDKNVPVWKILPEHIHEHDFRTAYGQDHTGNICHFPNLGHMIAQIGPGTCSLITADGGFDFSADFNNQESMCMHLIVAEIYAALQLQMQDGRFFLKLYDIYTPASFQILYILKTFYRDVYMIKPLTSRPANSEKYVLCSGFQTAPSTLRRTMLREMKIALQTNPLNMFFTVPTSFLRAVVNFNAYYIQKQIMSIYKTIAFILAVRNNKRDPRFMRNLKDQIRKGIKWCYKYKLAICPGAVQQYRLNYFADVEPSEPSAVSMRSPTTG